MDAQDNPIQTLREEHSLILARLNLFEEALAWLLATPASIGQLDALIRFLGRELPLHSRQEEECLFPELMAQDGFQPGWAALVGQEQAIRGAAGALQAAWEHLKHAASDDFPAAREAVRNQGEALIGTLREHIREEETTLFPFAERRLSAEQKADIGRRMRHVAECAAGMLEPLS